ncbi:MAG: TetR/AcrR family transcriptional regulator, partial [Rhodoblastus sp.]
LIAAATELTVQRGGPDFTLREIAALTGVRHAAVYRHFASKNALLEEIARLGVQALKSRIEQENGLAPGLRLEAIARDYLNFATSRPGEYRVMAQEGGASPSQYRALLDMMEEPIAAAQAAGAVCGDIAPDLLARLWWAELHGVAMLALNAAVQTSEIGECVRAMSHIWRRDAERPACSASAA